MAMAHSVRHPIGDRLMDSADDDGGRRRRVRWSIPVAAPPRVSRRAEQSREPMDRTERDSLSQGQLRRDPRTWRDAQSGEGQEHGAMRSGQSIQSLFLTPMYCTQYSRGSFQDEQGGGKTKCAHSIPYGEYAY